jgi:hypothetical protein
MRSRTLLRTLTRTLVVGVLSLLTASSVDAAPGPRQPASGAIWKAQSTAALKKLLRRAKSFGGPLASRPRLSRLGVHIDHSSHFQRAKRTGLGDDDAAIQNDAPAARVGAHDGPLSDLRPIGFLVGHVDSHPRTPAFSPRSPRGPPEQI